MAEIITLGKIDKGPLEKVFGKMKTDEVVITGERLKHIKTRHPEDFGLFEKYGAESIAFPDIIISDGKHDGTVFMVKRLPETNLNVIVRLVLKDDNKPKNSVMTFYRIRERNLKKLMERNAILYKAV